MKYVKYGHGKWKPDFSSKDAIVKMIKMAFRYPWFEIKKH